MKVENGYLIVELDEIKKFKKITGHSFVQLIGLDPFTKVGDCLLLMHGFYSEKVDEKWLKRGEFAEKIVQSVYKRDGHKITTYNKYDIQFDNFQDYLWYGGLIDIELLEEETLVEVKSKALKDYDYICKNPPLHEVFQGMFYGYLRHYKSINMEWVFFDEKTQNEIFEDKPITTLKNLKKFPKTYNVDENFMKLKLDEALQIVLNFRETGRIHISDISDKVLKYLGIDREQIMLADLPF